MPDGPGRQAALRNIESLRAQKAVIDQNARTVGSNALTATITAQGTGASNTQENGMIAARNAQDIIRQDLAGLVSLFQQSGAGLMQSEQSIEQMKAGFSGMLQILGIVAKHLGAEEFGQSCIDLATELRPQLVTVNGNARTALEGFIRDVNTHPELTGGYIVSAQDAAISGIARSQGAVERSAESGGGSARGITQPTALDGQTGGGGGAQTVSNAFRAKIGTAVTAGTVKGPQAPQVIALAIRSDADHNGQLDAGEQRNFRTGAIGMLGAAKAAVLDRSLGVTGAPNATPVVIGAPAGAGAPVPPHPH